MTHLHLLTRDHPRDTSLARRTLHPYKLSRCNCARLRHEHMARYNHKANFLNLSKNQWDRVPHIERVAINGNIEIRRCLIALVSCM